MPAKPKAAARMLPPPPLLGQRPHGVRHGKRTMLLSVICYTLLYVGRLSAVALSQLPQSVWIWWLMVSITLRVGGR